MKRRSADELEARNMFWVAVGFTCAWAGCGGGIAWVSIKYPGDVFPWWIVLVGTLCVLGAIAGLLAVPAAWAEWVSERREARRGSVNK